MITAVPKLFDSVKIRKDGDNYRLWAGESFCPINKAAKEIVDLCNGENSIDEICTTMSERYPLSGADVITKCVLHTVTALWKTGLFFERNIDLECCKLFLKEGAYFSAPCFCTFSKIPLSYISPSFKKECFESPLAFTNLYKGDSVQICHEKPNGEIDGVAILGKSVDPSTFFVHALYGKITFSELCSQEAKQCLIKLTRQESLTKSDGEENDEPIFYMRFRSENDLRIDGIGASETIEIILNEELPGNKVYLCKTKA